MWLEKTGETKRRRLWLIIIDGFGIEHFDEDYLEWDPIHTPLLWTAPFSFHATSSSSSPAAATIDPWWKLNKSDVTDVALTVLEAIPRELVREELENENRCR